MDRNLFNIGDIVRGDFPADTNSRHKIGEIVDVMESEEGQLVRMKVDGVTSPEWVPENNCILLRGVPLEGTLEPNEVAIIKRLIELYKTDNEIEELIRVAVVHEDQGIITREERRELLKILRQYREEKREHYVKLSRRLLEIHGDVQKRDT